MNMPRELRTILRALPSFLLEAPLAWLETRPPFIAKALRFNLARGIRHGEPPRCIRHDFLLCLGGSRAATAKNVATAGSPSWCLFGPAASADLAWPPPAPPANLQASTERPSWSRNRARRRPGSTRLPAYGAQGGGPARGRPTLLPRTPSARIPFPNAADDASWPYPTVRSPTLIRAHNFFSTCPQSAGGRSQANRSATSRQLIAS